MTPDPKTETTEGAGTMDTPGFNTVQLDAMVRTTVGVCDYFDPSHHGNAYIRTTGESVNCINCNSPQWKHWVKQAIALSRSQATPDPRTLELARDGEMSYEALCGVLAALQQRVEQVTAELAAQKGQSLSDVMLSFALVREVADLRSAKEDAERNASLAIKARDAYDEERRQSYQAMCGWKGRAEAAEATIASLTSALNGVCSTSRGYPCWCDASHNAVEYGHQEKCRTALASLPSSPVSRPAETDKT